MTKKSQIFERNKTLKNFGRKHVPLPTGHFQIIGCRDFMVGFTKKGGVLVRLYYPAADQSKRIEENHLVWPKWLPHENYKKGFIDVMGIRSKFISGIIERLNSNDTFIPAVVNAKPLRRSEPFPVIVFSHGLGCCRTSYSAICLELASHGFVVAAVEHHDNSACLSFYAKQIRMSDSNQNLLFQETQEDIDHEESDFGLELDSNCVPPKVLSSIEDFSNINMEWVRYNNIPLTKSGQKIYSVRNKQVHQRANECIRALDLLQSLQSGYELNILDPLFDVSEFEGLLDLNKAIIMGHSFGGGTTILSAAKDSRFKVAICLDAWLFPIHKEECLDSVSQPVLFINSKSFELINKRNLEMTKAFISPPEEVKEFSEARKAFTIKQSTHLHFCDGTFILGKFVNFMFGASFSTNPFTIHDIAMALTLDFLEKHLGVEINEKMKHYIEEKKRKIVEYPRSKL